MKRLPLYMHAPMAALQFSAPDYEPLSRLTEKDWIRTLRFCDRSQLTLPLGLRCRERLPDSVRARIDRNLANNAERWNRVQAAYKEVAKAFGRPGIECVVLKGFSHCPCFIPNPRWRPQYDLDLLLSKDQLSCARDVVRWLGYEPLGTSKERVDHLPTMIRKTGWQWRGDLFDPEIPLSIELHFRLWDEQTELFGVSGLEAFWERRVTRELEGLDFVALNDVDAVGYASAHALRHLLRGDTKASNLYELAAFLDRNTDDALWARWKDWHDPSLRRAEAICFALAKQWFDCALPSAASEEIVGLPPDVTRWIEAYAFSPLRAHPNKDELWLHWSLIDSRPGRRAMLRRRVLPMSLPGPVDAVHVPGREITWQLHVRRRWRYALYTSSRVGHHVGAVPRIVIGAARWFSGLPAPYWTFFATAALFNFGLFIFFFLFNLYLLQLGFHEDFLGLISGTMTAGSFVGCLPAALAMRRFGMQRTLFAAFLVIVCVGVLRATVINRPALVALAFFAGVFGSTWGVAISPIVAQVTNQRTRALGFSLILSSGVAIGVLGGLVAGILPPHLAPIFLSKAGSYQASLLLGCAIALLSLWPLSRLKVDTAPVDQPVFQRPGRALRPLFGALIVWNLGTGLFNPFFSAFFVHLHWSTVQIGGLFSGIHLVQACAMIAAPVVMNRAGIVRSVAGMQLATSLSLVGLALSHGAAFAAVACIFFMAAQYMSEPGVFSLLMDRVPREQRAGVSAFNMMVIFSAQAVAGGVAGILITRFGYAPVLACAAAACAAAAWMFGRLRIAPLGL